MANAKLVLRSINAEGGDRCVDIFQRPDGTVGFEEYRRDVEDGRGWFAVGHHSARAFADAASAVDAAAATVAWLAVAMRGAKP